jgi:hypothetical protein
MDHLIPEGQAWTFQRTAFLEDPEETRYIQPDYHVPDEQEVKSSPYLVISAPGAVGKSAFGNHLKRAKNAMLWNLAKLRLGSNTFIGSVLQAVGPSQLPEFLASIAAGNTTLVFDAIDEAEMHSGWSGVQDFLTEVIQYTPNARAASVIFLARRDTAEMLDLALADLVPSGRTYATVGIGFFPRERAIEFILSYIENAKGSTYVQRNESVLRSKASEALSLSVAPIDSDPRASGWNSAEQERFFGYAPVLQTVGKLLSESENPYTLSFNGSGAGYASIVTEILERILDREKEKLGNAVVQRFPNEQEQLVGLYSREDQQARILGLLTSDDDAAYSLPPKISPQIAVEVVDMLRGFLPQHPFLDGARFAGPAFRDYVLAHGLTSADRRFSSELWIDMAQPLYTPILASLYHAAGSGEADANDAELLYESANAGALNGQSGLLMFLSEQSPGRLALEIASDESDPLGERLVFDASIPAEVRFLRRLNNAQVIVTSSVVLGRRDQGFDISESEVQAKSIRIESNRISVRSETGRPTHIEATEAVVAPPTLKVDLQAKGLLTVSWPGSKNYPWTAYSVESRAQDANVNAETTLHVVARILGWFRKDRRKEYGRYRDLIVKHVVGQSTTARYALGFIEHIGALSESGNLFFIDTNILDSYEVSWQKIQSGTVSQRAIDAVESYLRDTPQPPQF